MHNLFLGLVKHHFWVVIGTHWEEPPDDLDVTEEQEVSEKELRKAHAVMASNPSQGSLHKFSIPVLHVLCSECGIQDQIKFKGKKSKKLHFISPLLASLPMQSRSNPAAMITLEGGEKDDIEFTQSVGLEGGLLEIIIDLGDETASNDFGAMLHTEDLRQIQEDIKNMMRPTWQAGPPANFGSPAHGKLKADQWRTCIEFYLPVSLMKMWSTGGADVPDELWLWRQHAEAARQYLELYLRSLRELCPNMDLHPVHHNTLHLPDFLLRFGPIHGWWMFPFERLIGILQKVNNNYKIGELEATTLKSFCAASQLKVLVEHPGCPKVLEKCVPILHKCFLNSKIGTLMHDIHTLDQEEHAKKVKVKEVDLEEDVHCAFELYTKEKQPKRVIQYAHYDINGQGFTMENTTP
ncbi:uncharacterized protein LACBIDRAFT_306513 [Laccaria bicolor S238N-H82]|uniref:Predicted protein n=1 Tax=Laccaria bicolor (strain S238N-H82 / ATCC MYA-4686) TaxID=486041 RepID=B0DN79_LACBS|nr:uncharacterized protein LACBIDRAFT_306513 [Laccaria bicolor S238N-H82]EDR03826.1 predicted protein [Laccaria bicolor S238N-H82]|eukprot:XP_001885394.1 predicted protein [Laccaria bicolor S238N-H82]